MSLIISRRCQHCQKLEPHWNRLARALKPEGHVVAEVDCTDEKGKELCSYYQVRQLPTLRAFSPRAPLNGTVYGGKLKFDDLAAYARAELAPGCAAADDDRCAEIAAFGVAVDAMSAREQTDALAALQAEYDASLAAEDAAIRAAEAAHAADKARIEPRMHRLRTALTARQLQRRRAPEPPAPDL